VFVMDLNIPRKLRLLTTPKIKSLLHRKYNKRCAYCGEEITLKEMTVDHIHPASLGGSNDPENLNPCCYVCNGFKKDLSIGEFRDEIEEQLSKTITKQWFNLLYKFDLINVGDGNIPVVFYFEKISRNK